MFDLGDEFIIGNYRIPWLIWIQLLVMFLLIILLYSFSLFALDRSGDSAAASSSSGLLTSINESHVHPRLPNTTSTTVASYLQNTKVGENQRVKGDIGTSTGRRIVRREDIQETEGSSTKDATHVTLIEHSYHPCHYLGLAKEAFLKCLGFDSTSETSSNRKQGKGQ